MSAIHYTATLITIDKAALTKHGCTYDYLIPDDGTPSRGVRVHCTASGHAAGSLVPTGEMSFKDFAGWIQQNAFGRRDRWQFTAQADRPAMLESGGVYVTSHGESIPFGAELTMTGHSLPEDQIHLSVQFSHSNVAETTDAVVKKAFTTVSTTTIIPNGGSEAIAPLATLKWVTRKGRWPFSRSTIVGVPVELMLIVSAAHAESTAEQAALPEAPSE